MLFRGSFSDDLFVEVSENNISVLYHIGANRVHEELNMLADAYTHGDPDAVINAFEFQNIQDFWRAKQHRVAHRRPVFRRQGYFDGAIWVDLTHADGHCIKVTPGRWSVERPPHAMFVRYATQRPLPVPMASDEGDTALDRVLPPEFSSDDKKLLTAALLGFRIPRGFARSFSYPILAIVGDSGVGKTTLAKLSAELIDNHVAPVAARPKSADDLFVAAQKRHLISFDNIDFIKGTLSDACAQLVTGSAVEKRRLYTDQDQVVLKAHAPILFSGIAPDIPRQDFLDRCITIKLKRIKEFDADAGHNAAHDLQLVQGYLCDLLATALANYPTTTLNESPRLALVAKIAMAARIPGCETRIVDLLASNQADALTTTRENDPIIDALFTLLANSPHWTGTYKELLGTLTNTTDDATTSSPDWPRTPHKFAAFIREHTRLLEELRIQVTNGPKQNNGRIVTVSRLPGFGNTSELPF